jgi:molybdopterin-guanine dinucleotide biosynthesis protein MobB
MKRLHIIGRKNHGKTTLIVDLVQALTGRGLRVGTIKHTHHGHELDTPGKDSYRHRLAGAHCAGILSTGMSAIFWPTGNESSEERYTRFASLQSGCDLVLVEGDVQTTADKLEVWRAEAGGEPLAASDPTIVGVISDDSPGVRCAVFRREKLDELIAWVIERAGK